VERTRGDLRLGAPLVAITAAVVGVMANLAVFLAWKVFLPEATGASPFAGRVDMFAFAVTTLALRGRWSKMDISPKELPGPRVLRRWGDAPSNPRHTESSPSTTR
jgi:hypothetical protein